VTLHVYRGGLLYWRGQPDYVIVKFGNWLTL